MTEPAQSLLELRGAGRIEAADVGRVCLLLHLRAARGTTAWGHNRLRPFGPLVDLCFDYVRDHFPCPLDDKRIAQVQIEPLDLVDIVQRDVGHSDAADENRLEQTDGRQIASLADLPANV